MTFKVFFVTIHKLLGKYEKHIRVEVRFKLFDLDFFKHSHESIVWTTLGSVIKYLT